MELTANCHTGEVTVKQVGPNSSALDGIELIQNKEYKMKPSATLFILTGLYPQRLKIVDNRQTEAASETKLDKTYKTHNGEARSKSDGHRHKDKDTDESLNANSSKKKHSEKTKETDHSKSKESESAKKHVSKSGLDKEKENGSVNSGFKRPNSSHEIDRITKKPKLVEKEDGHKSRVEKNVRFSTKSDKASSENSDDESEVKDITEKLKALKEGAKKLKAPEKATVSPTTSGSVVTKGFWEKIESLYVYRSKGLKGSSKVWLYHNSWHRGNWRKFQNYCQLLFLKGSIFIRNNHFLSEKGLINWYMVLIWS